MAWKTEGIMDQKLEFVVRARRGEETMTALCREYEMSRPTGYLWLKRYTEAGTITALEEKSRRPHSSPNKTDEELEEKVLRVREAKGWGALKIEKVLSREGEEISSSTVHRILVRRGVVKPDPGARKAVKRYEREECNQMAQMDFKGEYEVEVGEAKCYPLSFLDDHSRYLLGLWPLRSTGAEGVYKTLRNHFREHGVPESILTDHGTPWWSTTNGHGLTWLSVWLMKQSISLKYSGICHPQTQGKVERMHRTLKDRTRHRQLPTTFDEWLGWAKEFCHEYNYERPHQAIGMKTPAEVYTTKNLRPYQESPPEWDYSGGKVHVLNSQGKLKYRDRRYFVCEALRGERVRVDEVDHLVLVTYRNTTVRQIDLRTGETRAVVLATHKRFVTSNAGSV
jgi:transposase InsO family protein